MLVLVEELALAIRKDKLEFDLCIDEARFCGVGVLREMV